MFAVSPRWARTVRQSHRASIDAVAYQAPRNGAPSTPTPVAVSEWSLTASTTARSRYELTATIRELRPKELWVTHGRDDALLHWCGLNQIRARALHLVGREDDAE